MNTDNKIFISYKRYDKDIIFKIKDYIESNVGVKCWIDLDGIESDAQFANVIIKAINEAKVFLFMYSSSHAKIEDYDKDWTVREISFAQKKNKRIVFVNIDKTPLTDWFELIFGTKQQVDASSDTAMQKLCKDLKKWVGSTDYEKLTKNNGLEHKVYNSIYFKTEYSFDELMKKINKNKEFDPNKPFLLPVEDVFYIKNRGMVATGLIESGTISVGDKLDVIGYGRKAPTICTGIEMNRQILDKARAGDTVGILLRGLDENDIIRGQVVAAHNSISESNVFTCDCYFMDDNENNVYPLSIKEQFSFYMRTVEVPGKIELSDGVDHIDSNDYLPAKVTLTTSVPVNRGLLFAIRINNKTIGVGIVKAVF